jgi:hypothetical protein
MQIANARDFLNFKVADKDQARIRMIRPPTYWKTTERARRDNAQVV